MTIVPAHPTVIITRVSRDIRLIRNGTEYLPFEANIRFGYSLRKIANIRLFAILRMRNFEANMNEYDANRVVTQNFVSRNFTK